MAQYIIASGGTGARCLESFVHLCAIGMFDNQSFNILLMDTDYHNGNLSRTQKLIQYYNTLKGERNTKREDGFFSAELTLYSFICDYQEGADTFRAISRPTGLDEQANLHNQWLSDLLIDEKTQEFKLEHGYRTQTHIGSYLMYHGILAEVSSIHFGHKEADEKNICKFLEIMTSDAEGGRGAKVFIFGSVFGGTGASTLPILPRALKDASRIIGGSASEMADFMYGATVLTNYFNFSSPKQEELDNDKIIANADEFALNSQAALMFYEDDPTIKKNYKRLYLVGWNTAPSNFSTSNGKIITGGQAQINDSHPIELMCAFAAYDYFHTTIQPTSSLSWRYRSIEINNGNFQFTESSFVSAIQSEFFRKKLLAFTALAIMIQNDFGGNFKNFVDKINKDKFVERKGVSFTVSEAQIKAINEYLSLFAYQYVNDGKGEFVQKGWLQQMDKHAKTNHFLISQRNIFSDNVKILKAVKWGELHENAEKHFGKKKGLFDFSASPYNDLHDALKKYLEGNALPANIENPIEQLLYITYYTLNKLHNY